MSHCSGSKIHLKLAGGQDGAFRDLGVVLIESYWLDDLAADSAKDG